MLARETDDIYFLALMLRQRGMLALRQGDLDLARTVSRESLALFRKIGNQWGAAVATANLGSVHYFLADYVTAAAHFQDALRIYRVFEDKLHIAATLLDLGGIAQLQCNYPQAIAFLDDSLATCREIGRAGDMAQVLCDLGIAVGQQGDHARAAALLAEALSLHPKTGSGYGNAACLLGLAGIQEQPVCAVQFLAAAHTAFEATGDVLKPFHRAAAQHIEKAARVVLSEESFAAAWAEGRALTLEQAIENALAAKVQSQSVPPAAPIGPLNARELEILHFIAEGLSNHEIADRLVIALSTVKWHVSNLFGKLGVNSRTQAIARAKELGLL